MLPRAVPPYPGPLSMTPEQHYELVEAQALITEEGDRILFEENITLNVDFGTRVEERHVEDCVCVVCGEVERGMGGRAVVTGGVAESDGCEEESGECVCADEEKERDGDGDHDDNDNDHDGESLFIGTGEVSQVKISKPLSPELHRMRRRKQAGSRTASISTVSSMSTIHADEWKKRNVSLEYDDEYQVSEMDSSEETELNFSGVTIAYSHAPIPSSGSGDDVLRGRGRSLSQELHATWDSQVKNKECWSDKASGGIARSLSKKILSIGRGRDKEGGSDGSAGSRTSKVWNFARSLSRRSNNSGHSSRTIQPAKDDHAMLGAQMDGSEYQDQHSSFEEGENPNMSFQGDEDIMESRDSARAFIGPRRNPEIHDFPKFDPAQFTPSNSAHAASDNARRRSGSESDVSTLGPHEARSRSRSTSPSLRFRHYSSRGSFSLNWDNISSDTVYHKHARRIYQNPAAYGAEIPGYNPETDNPYLAYDRYREVSEWADSTEEEDPDHVVALTTRELKRLCEAEIRIPFDFIPEGYVNPPTSKVGSVVGDDENVVTVMEMEEDDEEQGPEPRHKNLVDLLGMPGWAHEWEDMTKMHRHFHIVAAGDWRMGPAFDVKSNYSDYFGVPLFEPNDVGLDGVNRREVRGLDIPGLKELELRFRLEGCEEEDDGYEKRDQRRCFDEDVKAGSPTEYDSDGFLYDDDTQREVAENFDPREPASSEVDRFSRRPSEVSLSNRSGDGSEEGYYAGSIVEGYGITDDRRTGANTNVRIDDSFRGRIARSYTLNSRFGQDTFAPSNTDSLISEDSYDTDDDEEEYESDDGISANYSFGNSSYHGTACQEDYAIGTSKFAPHAFQLYPPYEAANDPTTIGIAPSEMQNTRPSSWDADFMEDILAYSVHEENHKPHDPTAEMVIMSYLDPVPALRRSSTGAKSRSRSSTGSLTTIPSPTKSTRTTRSFVPSVKSLSRTFARNRPLPATPEDASCKPFSKYESKSASSLRKPSLSTANIAKLNKHKEKSSLPKPSHSLNPTPKTKSVRSKTTLSKISIKSKPKSKHNPILRLKPRRSKITAPPSSTSSSDSNTSYVDLTRSGSAYAVPPAQSLILYLHGCGLGADHIALLMQSLDEKFLYDSNSNWWPLDPLSSVSVSAIAPIRYLHPNGTTPLPNVPLCADSFPPPPPPPPKTNITPIRFPPHTLFTPTTVSQILQRCKRETEWWEPADARDPDGKALPESFRLLKKGMRVRKARELVRKTVENFLWWRIGGGTGVGLPHGNLMRG